MQRRAQRRTSSSEIRSGASFAKARVLDLLDALNSDKKHTADRRKALRQFEEYFVVNAPDLREGTARLLLLGAPPNTRGLLRECGVESRKHPGRLKATNSLRCLRRTGP